MRKQAKDLKAVQVEFIEDTIKEGLTIISAPPKKGKTTLALQIAVALAEGSEFFGKASREKEVLYQCEYCETDLYNKLQTITDKIPGNLFYDDSPELDGIDADVLVLDGLDRCTEEQQEQAIGQLFRWANEEHKAVIVTKHITEIHPWADAAETIISLERFNDNRATMKIRGRNIRSQELSVVLNGTWKKI